MLQPLRLSVTRFAGADGYSSLLRRALALSREEITSLKNVTLGAGGRLEGLVKVGSGAGIPGDEAMLAVLAHLLGLLVVFVGESLTLKLMREAWPGISPDELSLSKGAAE